MRKLLVICGPTATGKTSLGIRLAKKFNGEIVSADSRQVYKGMKIGTGKDLPKFTIYNLQFTINEKKVGYYLFNEIPVWLLDVVEPDEKFSVADYYELAWMVIKNIWERGKLPIVVGGTGFYIKALLEGIGTIGVPADWELRKKLQSCRVAELQSILQEICPERWQGMNESDRQNPRRLIRAIEVARKMQNAKCKMQNDNSKFKIDKLFIGLTAPFGILYQRIDQRVEERVKMGAEEEIRRLLDEGYTWTNSVMGTTIGYREWREYFAGKIRKYEVIQKWKYAEHNYARRQKTWFKKTLRQAQGKWFDITGKDFQKKVEKLVESWYS